MYLVSPEITRQLRKFTWWMKGFAHTDQSAAKDIELSTLTHPNDHDGKDRDEIERRFLGFYKLPGGLLSQNLGRGVFITGLGSKAKFVDSSNRGLVPVRLRVSTEMSDHWTLRCNHTSSRTSERFQALSGEAL